MIRAQRLESKIGVDADPRGRDERARELGDAKNIPSACARTQGEVVTSAMQYVINFDGRRRRRYS